MSVRNTPGSQIARITRPIPKTVGAQWYVDGADGDDGNDGMRPANSFATIGKALTEVAAGDIINVGVGVYDENGLELDKDGLQLLAARGTCLVDTTGGTQTLLVSGTGCTIVGVSIIQAGQIGIKITGDVCLFLESAVPASTIGCLLEGDNNIIERTFFYGYSTTGVEVTGAHNLLLELAVTGTNGPTRGIYLSDAAADYNKLRFIFSSGNATSPIEMVPGCQGNTIQSASFGAGDGRWIDGDNVWSDFTFDDIVYHTTVFSGGGPGAENLFRVYGSVDCEFLSGDVEVALSADVGNIYLRVWDGADSDLITSNIAGGVDISSAPVDSFLVKTEDSGTALEYLASDRGRVFEQTSFTSPRVPFGINAKAGAATYIRVVWNGTATSGQIHWHLKWSPANEIGFIEPA
jgi:hypothetical protein